MTDEQFARLCRLINPELLVGEDVLFDVDLIEAFIGRHTDSFYRLLGTSARPSVGT